MVKSEYLLIGSKPNIDNLTTQPNVFTGDEPVKRFYYTKALGIQIDQFIKIEVSKVTSDGGLNCK